MSFDVFISYPHQDKAAADAACAKLEGEGIRCWIAPRDIPAGAEWAGAIVDAIDQCRAMVLIFSSSANASKQVHREVQQAFDGEKPVMPFRIENVTPEKSLRYYMGSVHWLDALTPPLERHLEKLVASVRALVRVRTFEGGIQKAPILPGPEAAERVEALQTVRGAEGMRAEGRIQIDAAIVHGAPNDWFKPGAGKSEWFKDHKHGPELVVVPAGEFMMGSPETEAGRTSDEGPQHMVTFTQPFAVGRFAVTFDEWNACVADGGGNGYTPDDNGWGRGRRPVIKVSWNEAKAYVAWLAWKTEKPYRLLSEAEREYVTRAGTITPYWWGSSIATTQANYAARPVRKPFERESLPVDSFAPNPWGLHQVHGNIWDWTEDCYHNSYSGAPDDGSAWTSDDCSHRVIRGGCWGYIAPFLRSASRHKISPDFRDNGTGLRVARTLPAP
jgi:formylglycine-generating enzyme required for sulfatase activity